MSDTKIRQALKLSPHLYNKKKNEVIDIMRESLNVAQEEY